MTELRTIDDLRAASYNPRTITSESAAGLAASIESFGDISGITFNTRTGNLVCGHQRVEQIKKLGGQLFNTADGVELRVGRDGKRFAVRLVDWDIATEKAANVTANNRHIGGEFTADLDALLAEVEGSIGEEKFGELQLDRLLAQVALPEDVAPPDDFDSFDENIETEHQCPKCGYKWSGKPTSAVDE